MACLCYRISIQHCFNSQSCGPVEHSHNDVIKFDSDIVKYVYGMFPCKYYPFLWPTIPLCSAQTPNWNTFHFQSTIFISLLLYLCFHDFLFLSSYSTSAENGIYCVFHFKILFTYLFLATPRSMQDLSSLARDWTHAPRVEVQSLNQLNHQGSPLLCF